MTLKTTRSDVEVVREIGRLENEGSEIVRGKTKLAAAGRMVELSTTTAFGAIGTSTAEDCIGMRVEDELERD